MPRVVEYFGFVYNFSQTFTAIYDKASSMTHLLMSAWCKRVKASNVFVQKDDILNIYA